MQAKPSIKPRCARLPCHQGAAGAIEGHAKNRLPAPICHANTINSPEHCGSLCVLSMRTRVSLLLCCYGGARSRQPACSNGWGVGASITSLVMGWRTPAALLRSSKGRTPRVAAAPGASGAICSVSHPDSECACGAGIFKNTSRRIHGTAQVVCCSNQTAVVQVKVCAVNVGWGGDCGKLPCHLGYASNPSAR